METNQSLTTTPIGANQPPSGLAGSLRSWLGGQTGLVVGAIVGIGAVVALNATGLGLGSTVPLLFLLPCAVMALMMFIMIGMGEHQAPASPDTTPSPAPPSAEK